MAQSLQKNLTYNNVLQYYFLRLKMRLRIQAGIINEFNLSALIINDFLFRKVLDFVLKSIIEILKIFPFRTVIILFSV